MLVNLWFCLMYSSTCRCAWAHTHAHTVTQPFHFYHIMVPYWQKCPHLPVFVFAATPCFSCVFVFLNIFLLLLHPQNLMSSVTLAYNSWYLLPSTFHCCCWHFCLFESCQYSTNKRSTVYLVLKRLHEYNNKELNYYRPVVTLTWHASKYNKVAQKLTPPWLQHL